MEKGRGGEGEEERQVYLAHNLNMSSIVSGWSMSPVGPLRRENETVTKLSVMANRPE